MYSELFLNDTASEKLDLAKLLPEMQPYLQPNKIFYFIDFLITFLIGNVCLVLAAMEETGSLIQFVLIIIASLALFRMTIFMHEIYHLNKKLGWTGMMYNLFHGFLHKVPLYNYNTHLYHHLPRTYGTMEDAEYDNLGHRGPFYILVFSPFVVSLFLPLFLIIRWGIIPFLLPFIGSNGRTFVFRYMSTLALNLKYVRPLPTDAEKKEWYLQDAGCAVYTLATAVLLYTGVLPITLMGVWCAAIYLTSVINYYRVIMSHRYISNFTQTSHKQQIIDSTTLPPTLFNTLFFPVGLRYHALHHMFPQIPYHNMEAAHRHLLTILPKNHPYHATILKNYCSGLRSLLNHRQRG
ncbi:MAG: fatty acid desaturase [Alphaproteobacteria bacterium]|nr:fatty acid desaturase [Alphaproteobacteria bacterium]